MVAGMLGQGHSMPLADVQAVLDYMLGVLVFIAIPILLVLNGVNWLRNWAGPRERAITSAEQEVAKMHSTAESERQGFTQERRNARQWHG